MRVTPERRVERTLSRRRVLSTVGEIFSTTTVCELVGGVVAQAWSSVNDPLAIPFRISESVLIDQLGWINGAGALTDSIDVGVYDASFNRLVSGGGTARTGANVIQWVNVTDTWLTPGKYFLAASANGVTAAQQLWVNHTAGANLLSLLGIQDSATNAYPLPNPLTNMALAATFTRIPLLTIATRAPF